MYIYKISSVTVLYHKRSTVQSIFQISISQNTKCTEMVSFPRDGHICYCHVQTLIEQHVLS